MFTTVTRLLRVSEGYAALDAVILCSPIAFGAVYSPVPSMVPTELLPPAVPSTDQFTPVLVSPVIVAVYRSVWPGESKVEPEGLGEMPKVNTVTGAVVLFPGPVPLLAAIVWIPAWEAAV